MPSAGWALQKAIYEKLIADTELTSLLGGPHVHDDVPRGTAPPYVTIGQSTVRDWSTGSEDGQEHMLTLHVWSRAVGRRQIQEMMAAVHASVHGATLSLTGHRLVNLRHELTESRRDTDGETYHGIMRYRAVTEPV